MPKIPKEDDTVERSSYSVDKFITSSSLNDPRVTTPFTITESGDGDTLRLLFETHVKEHRIILGHDGIVTRGDALLSYRKRLEEFMKAVDRKIEKELSDGN